MAVPTDEQKKVCEEIGAILQQSAASVARSVNLHRKTKPHILTDSLKVHVWLGADWVVRLIVRYAGVDHREKFQHSGLALLKLEDLLKFFFRRLSTIISNI